jgi:hypothetical protein
MSGMCEIVGAIALSSMVSVGVVAVETQVSAQTNAAKVQFQAVASERPLKGVFYNLTSQEGGTAEMNLSATSSSVSGFINFTQFPESTRIHCGAGDLNSKRAGNIVTGRFISNDPDPGCNYDKNGIFTINANANL